MKKNIFTYFHYQDFLRDLYLEQVSINSHYTLTDFADWLQISVSMLSQVLNKKRNISLQVASKIAKKIKLSPEETLFFKNLITSQHSSNKIKKEKANQDILEKKQKNLKSFSLKDFSIIREWHYLAIREATFILPIPVHGPKQDLAHFLDLSEEKINQALQKLLSLDLIYDAGGFYKATDTFFTVESSEASEAIQLYHRQILKIADLALAKNPQEREYSSLLLSIKKDDVPKAKKLIQKFRQEFNQIMVQDGDPNSLYCLALQFFEISQ